MNRPELTYEEFCGKTFLYTMGLRLTDCAVRQYRNEELGVGYEVNTPYNDLTMEWGRPTVIWFMVDDKRNFDTPDQLYVAYMEKVCGVVT